MDARFPVRCQSAAQRDLDAIDDERNDRAGLSLAKFQAQPPIHDETDCFLIYVVRLEEGRGGTG